MNPLLIILPAVVLLVLGAIVAYWRTRRRRVARVIAALDRAGIENILAQVLASLRTKHPDFILDDFEKAAVLLEREFTPANDAFLALLPRASLPNGFPDYWLLDIGILFGELVRRHSLSPSDWAQDSTGTWKLRFNLGSQDFWWDPFKQAEDRFTGKTPSLLMALKLVQTLK